MRTPVLSFFDEALKSTFNSTLETMLGSKVRDQVERILTEKGIPQNDTANRFDDVVTALMGVFGECARTIVHRVLLDLYGEYSLRVDFSYQDSLRDRLLSLKERVVADHLKPRRGLDTDHLFDTDKQETSDEETSGRKPAWTGFYRFKKGVGTDSGS